MPALVRMYIRHVLIGFGLSAAFVAALLWFDVAHLRHLILDGDMAVIATLMLFVGNGIVFSGVQFAIAVMRMQEGEQMPPSGLHQAELIPIRVEKFPRR